MLRWSENSEDVTPDGDGGVRKVILKESHDKNGFLPVYRDLIKVHYVGYFEDGTCFTSSLDSQETRSFILGRGEVLKGWEIAVSTMKLNELSVFCLSPEYAYGSTGLPPSIEPNKTIYFQLELLSIEGEHITKDGSVTRNILVHGGFNNKAPFDNDICTVSYSTQLFTDPTTVIENVENVTFTLGEGFEIGVPNALEKALKKMKKGERSRLKSRCGSGLSGYKKLGVPAMSDLIHYVELIDFQETKKHWDMSREELMENALAEKESGVMYFKMDKYQMASRRFSRCLLYADSINLTVSELRMLEEMKPNQITDDLPVHTPDTNDVRSSSHADGNAADADRDDSVRNFEIKNLYDTKQMLIVTSLLNMSLCDHKIGKHLKALDHVSRVLDIDPANIKALFRKAMINFHLKFFDEAKKYFVNVLKLRPDMKLARKHLELCRAELNERDIHSKRIFGCMFEKFAIEDSQKEFNKGQKEDIFTNVGEWDNKMAEGMMTLEQEMAAFGETMPEKGYDKENDNPASDED